MLRLHGDVERGGRLVGDQQLRRAGERHGDHRPLALAARELERIGAGDALGIAQPTRASSSTASAQAARRASCRDAGRAARRPGAPMRCSGLSAVIGSWKTMPMRSPRSLLHLGLVEPGEIARPRSARRRRPSRRRAAAPSAPARSSSCRSRIRRPRRGSRRRRARNETSCTTRRGPARRRQIDGEVGDGEQHVSVAP